MKNKLFLLFIAVLVIGLAACGGKSSGASSGASSSGSSDSQADKPAAVESITPEASSQNWDKIISDYEKLIDDYEALVKKIKNGDLTAMAKLEDISGRAEKLSGQLENASAELSSAQISKLAKLQKKLTDVATSMLN